MKKVIFESVQHGFVATTGLEEQTSVYQNGNLIKDLFCKK